MANEDGTLVQRIAFLCVLFSGFAYTGYALVSKIIRQKKKGSSANLLNKATQTEDPTKSKIPELIRCPSPKSVRERVSDLNQLAQVLRKSSVPLSPDIRPHSFRTSPWSSPLGCARYLSVSAENISTKSPNFSPEHKAKSKLTTSQWSLNTELQSRLTKLHLKDVASQETLLQDEESVLVKTLNNLHRAPSMMTCFEVRTLIKLLHSSNEDVLLKTLYTISNCAAFSSNQKLLCDSGCPGQLKDLLLNHTEAVKIAVTQAISNVSVIEGSHRYFQPHIPILFHHALYGKELLKSLSLTALANLALDNASHKLIMENVNQIILLAKNGTDVVQLQSLRLLVNLSCNKDTVPALLISEVPPDILDMINNPSDKEILLRLLTFLANVVTYAAQYLDQTSKCTLVSVIHQLIKRTEFSNLMTLTTDKDDDINFQARRLHSALLAIKV